jgi:hypothetical protein
LDETFDAEHDMVEDSDSDITFHRIDIALCEDESFLLSDTPLYFCECLSLDFRWYASEFFGEAPDAVAKNYLEMTSGIAMSSGGGRNTNLEIVRG